MIDTDIQPGPQVHNQTHYKHNTVLIGLHGDLYISVEIGFFLAGLEVFKDLYAGDLLVRLNRSLE